MGFESGQMTDCGACGEVAFDDILHEFTDMVLVVGFTYLSSGENGAEPEKTILRTVKLGLGIVVRVHQPHELAGLDFRAWNMNS
jgi:hypothetical protein